MDDHQDRPERPVPLPECKVAGCLILASSKDQQLATGNEFYTYSTTIAPSGPPSKPIFFTDRSLYRPGQTIQYKGLCLAVDQEQDNYKTIAHRGADGGLLRPQQQGDRPSAGEDQRVRLVQRQLHGAARSADRPDVSPHRWHAAGRHGRPRGGVQAAEIPGYGRGSQDGTAAQRQGRHDRQGHGLHRGGSQRRQGPLARRSPGSLSYMVVLVLLVAHAQHRPARTSPMAPPSRRRTAASPSSSWPSPISPCRRRTSRPSTSRSRPT